FAFTHNRHRCVDPVIGQVPGTPSAHPLNLALMDSDTSTPNRRITFWLFLVITLLIGIDVATDLIAGSVLAHVAIEGSILLLAAGGLLQVWIENRHLRRQADDLGADLATSRAEALAWRNEAASALAGLAEAVDHQFVRWELTEAESDVARYLL